MQPLAIYVHWPFCASKCPYCDFNSHVREKVDQQRWAATLTRELRYWAALTQQRPIYSVFFGGGTPSLMHPDVVTQVLRTIHDLWPITPGCEVTLEANPNSVEVEKFIAFAKAGVNRVSLGIQSLDDTALKFLGRRHNAAEAARALDIAAEIFPRYSFDLIYALPGQSVAAWEDMLGAALQRRPTHLSLYQLTIEENTGFYTAHQRGDFTMPDEDLAGELYERTQSITAAHNLPAYEISNHATRGHECRHNLVYWRYQDYLGIGPGAHGRVVYNNACHATRNIRTPESWLTAVETHEHGLSETTALIAAEMAVEYMMMGLRLTTGIDAANFLARTGMPLMNTCNPDKLKQLQELGFLTWDETSLIATAAGRQRLTSVLREVINPALVSSSMT